MTFIKFANRQRGRNLFTFFDRQQIHQRLAARCTSGLRHFIDFLAEYAATIREEQQIIMRRCHHQLGHEIFILGGHGCLALAAAALGAVERSRVAFDITFAGNGHHHILFGNQVFDRQFRRFIHNFGTSRISIFITNGFQFFHNHAHEQFFVSQNRFQVGD